MFDVEISNFYGRAASQPQIITESKSLATINMPGTLESPLGVMKCSLPLSEPLPFEDSTPTSPDKNGLEQENGLSNHILDTIDTATSHHSMPPTAASQSASNVAGSLSVCGDFQQEPVNNATYKSHCIPDRDPCPTTTNALEQTKNPGVAEDKSIPSCQPYQ